MTNDTLYFLVTCTLEPTRLFALEKVVENLSTISDQTFLKDLVVFDNASTIPASDKLLSQYFPTVLKCEENVGFWSAIHWFLQNYEELMGRKYKYLYVIESDMIHTPDMIQGLQHCENFLNQNDDVGFVRVEEFQVANRHLYDKRQNWQDSRRYAWVVQDNYITRQQVSFQPVDGFDSRIFRTNFLAKVPVVSRVEAMTQIFEELSKLSKFNEMEYQRLYFERYQVSGLLDGGIFHSKLGNDNDVVIKGSHIGNEGRTVGYRETRSDRIVSVKNDMMRRL